MSVQMIIDFGHWPAGVNHSIAEMYACSIAGKTKKEKCL